jgi:predicted ATPase
VNDCSCAAPHPRRRLVLTGGPGAGKTAVLELIRRHFCEHVHVLPEAASLIFGGGFPRRDDVSAKEAAQRAIFFVQRELERMEEEVDAAIVLCDRGTLDGAAYWPSPEEALWRDVRSSRQAELARYDAVVHMRTPEPTHYNHDNPVRLESAAQARALDQRIYEVWAGHPRRYVIDSAPDFLTKAARTLEVLRAELPECCRGHRIAGLEAGAPRSGAGSVIDSSHRLS